MRSFITSLAVLALACTVPQALGAAGPFDTERSESQLVIVLDPNQPAEGISLALAQAGFPSLQFIPGIPPKYSNYRLVTVTNAGAETRAKLLAVPGVLGVRPVFTAKGIDYPILTTGQVIAKFAPGTPQQQVSDIAAQYGCTIARGMRVPQTYVLNLTNAASDVQAVSQQLAGNGQVVYAQPSIMFKLKRHAINDPLYPFQWHLKNTGQLAGGVPGADLDAEPAWEVTMGDGAIVGVIDDCLQKDHEDLKDNYLTGYDFLGDVLSGGFGIDPIGGDGDPSPYYGPFPYDPVGDAHGTAVSGIIAARANTIGVRGVAPLAKLIGCKIGLGSTYTTDQDVADAFTFCEANGAMVVNNSWGGPGMALLPGIPNTFLFPTVISEAIEAISTTGRGGLGVLVMFSSGNDAMLLGFGNRYAALPNVMAIGATMRDDMLSCYSNYGPEQSVVAPGGGAGFVPNCYDSDIATTDVISVPGHIPYSFDNDNLPDLGQPAQGFNPPMRYLDVASPIFCVNPTDPWSICLPLVDDVSVSDFPDHGYTHHMNGTSAACPAAAGVAALAFSVNPTMTAEQARNLIEHTAVKITAPNELFDTVTGHNDRYGHGRVSASRAVEAALAGHSWPSPVKSVQNVSSQGSVLLFWENPERDVASVLVVRKETSGVAGQLNWAPTDGIDYSSMQFQEVAPGVIIIQDSLAERLDDVGLPSGNYEYAIFVRNASNYYSWGRRVRFGASGASGRLLASISASPTTTTVASKVRFAGGGISENKIVSYSWSFGDGTFGTGATAEHTYVQGGTYYPNLKITDSTGRTAEASARVVVSNSSNASPIVTASGSPSSGQAPLVVVFQAVASDSDGSITRYDWDFGDGTTGAGQMIEHTYIAPGSYGATVTVTDDQGGASTDVVVITVSPTTTTAADTEPDNILSRPSLCGAGTASAVGASLLGMTLMMLGRGRRR